MIAAPMRFRCQSQGSPPAAKTGPTLQVRPSWKRQKAWGVSTISQLATQRSEFHSILQHEGVDGLIMVKGGSAPVVSVDTRPSALTSWGTFPWRPRRFAAKVSHNTPTGGKDGFWRGDVLHRLLDDPGGAGPGAGSPRL